MSAKRKTCPNRRATLLFWAASPFAALLIGFTASSGEPPAPAVPAPAVPVAPESSAVPKEEKPFIFAPKDRRDPFTFIDKYPTIIDTTTIPGVKTEQKTDKGIQEKKKEAEKLYANAEEFFMDGNSAEALLHCKQGTEIIKGLAEVDQANPEFQEILERLSRLLKAGQKIKERQEAERDFAMLNLKVTGVIAYAKHSQAIVTSDRSQVVAKGAFVKTNDSSEVLVYDIQPSEVIFLYHDYKIKLPISEGVGTK